MDANNCDLCESCGLELAHNDADAAAGAHTGCDLNDPTLTFSRFAALLDTYQPTDADYAEYAAWEAMVEAAETRKAERAADDDEREAAWIARNGEVPF